eukprot:1142877-Pelagomonas_calceolata.AAC.4
MGQPSSSICFLEPRAGSDQKLLPSTALQASACWVAGLSVHLPICKLKTTQAAATLGATSMSPRSVPAPSSA